MELLRDDEQAPGLEKSIETLLDGEQSPVVKVRRVSNEDVWTG
jgi:hypothetical protein